MTKSSADCEGSNNEYYATLSDSTRSGKATSFPGSGVKSTSTVEDGVHSPVPVFLPQLQEQSKHSLYHDRLKHYLGLLVEKDTTKKRARQVRGQLEGKQPLGILNLWPECEVKQDDSLFTAAIKYVKAIEEYKHWRGYIRLDKYDKAKIIAEIKAPIRFQRQSDWLVKCVRRKLKTLPRGILDIFKLVENKNIPTGTLEDYAANPGDFSNLPCSKVAALQRTSLNSANNKTVQSSASGKDSLNFLASLKNAHNQVLETTVVVFDEVKPDDKVYEISHAEVIQQHLARFQTKAKKEDEQKTKLGNEKKKSLQSKFQGVEAHRKNAKEDVSTLAPATPHYFLPQPCFDDIALFSGDRNFSVTEQLRKANLSSVYSARWPSSQLIRLAKLERLAKKKTSISASHLDEIIGSSDKLSSGLCDEEAGIIYATPFSKKKEKNEARRSMTIEESKATFELMLKYACRDVVSSTNVHQRSSHAFALMKNAAKHEFIKLRTEAKKKRNWRKCYDELVHLAFTVQSTFLGDKLKKMYQPIADMRYNRNRIKKEQINARQLRKQQRQESRHAKFISRDEKKKSRKNRNRRLNRNMKKFKLPLSKRRKRKKAIGAPLRPRSAFNFYSKSMRKRLAEEGCKLNPLDVMRLIGEKWHKTTAGERSKFIALADADQERYKKEKALFLATPDQTLTMRCNENNIFEEDDTYDDQVEIDSVSSVSSVSSSSSEDNESDVEESDLEFTPSLERIEELLYKFLAGYEKTKVDENQKRNSKENQVEMDKANAMEVNVVDVINVNKSSTTKKNERKKIFQCTTVFEFFSKCNEKEIKELHPDLSKNEVRLKCLLRWKNADKNLATELFEVEKLGCIKVLMKKLNNFPMLSDSDDESDNNSIDNNAEEEESIDLSFNALKIEKDLKDSSITDLNVLYSDILIVLKDAYKFIQKYRKNYKRRLEKLEKCDQERSTKREEKKMEKKSAKLDVKIDRWLARQKFKWALENRKNSSASPFGSVNNLKNSEVSLKCGSVDNDSVSAFNMTTMNFDENMNPQMKMRKRAKKKRRIPGGPVGPKIAYNFFTRKHRAQTKQEYPNAEPADIQRLLSAKWRVASQIERYECEKLAEEDRLRYKREVKEWTAANPDKAALFLAREKVRYNIDDEDEFDERFNVSQEKVKLMAQKFQRYNEMSTLYGEEEETLSSVSRAR
eukprot:g5069.t1